jgi:hypothetical protein
MPDPTEQLELVANAERQPKAPRDIAVSVSLVISPARIRESGLIRVRAIVDGARDEMKLGSLRVVQAF